MKVFRWLRFSYMSNEKEFDKKRPAIPTENPKMNNRKYPKYAVGEIILVVIGIIITENLVPTLKGGFSKTVIK